MTDHRHQQTDRYVLSRYLKKSDEETDDEGMPDLAALADPSGELVGVEEGGPQDPPGRYSGLMPDDDMSGVEQYSSFLTSHQTQNGPAPQSSFLPPPQGPSAAVPITSIEGPDNPSTIQDTTTIQPPATVSSDDLRLVYEDVSADGTLHIKPCDIYLTGGPSLCSRAIRIFSTSPGEPETKVNHAGIIVEDGSLYSAMAMEAQALSGKVCRHPLRYYAGKKSCVAIFRPTNLSQAEMVKIVQQAESYKDKPYGFKKIVMHFLDWCLGGRYFFRRFAKSENSPICSWVVVQSFCAANKEFGCDPGAAQPDDIWDFCSENPDKYQQIRELWRIPKEP